MRGERSSWPGEHIGAQLAVTDLAPPLVVGDNRAHHGKDPAMAVTTRLRDAMNSHDLDAFLDCFHQDYTSEQPIHPGRGFVGRDQVRANWAAVFAGVADFAADLV